MYIQDLFNPNQKKKLKGNKLVDNSKNLNSVRIRQLKHLRYNVKTAKSSYPNKMSFPSRNCNLHKQMYDNQTNPTILKVRLSQNGFMKSSIFQKMTRKI